MDSAQSKGLQFYYDMIPNFLVLVLKSNFAHIWVPAVVFELIFFNFGFSLRFLFGIRIGTEISAGTPGLSLVSLVSLDE